MGGFSVRAGGKAAPVFELITGAFNPVPLLVERGVTNTEEEIQRETLPDPRVSAA